MTITLPKALRTYQYRPLTVFSLLDVDTDRVLPRLLELCVKGGRSSPPTTDAEDFAGYRDRMLASGAVIGFEDKADRALLDGWLRSCVIEMGAVSRSRTGEQMVAAAPLSLASYRAGLPTERVRHRGVDDIVYRLLLDELERRGSGNPRAELRGIVAAATGKGLALGPEPRWEPQLVDPDRLDIGALLEFRFLEAIEMGDARPVAGGVFPSPLPGVAADLAATLLTHVESYGDRLPTPALMSSFAALLAVGLFTYTLRTDRAARELILAGERPADMADLAPASGLELYCDFTGDLWSESDRMCRRCVERDLDRVRQAFRDRMTFVVVENALSRGPEEMARIRALPPADQLVALAALKDHRRVENFAGARLDDLIDGAPDEGATEAEIEFLRRIQASDSSELDKLLDVLADVNQDKATKNSVKWYSSVGGITKPYGVLQGSNANRRSWRYAPSDELLQALLLAVFVDPDTRTVRNRLSLRAVLDILHERFGILVDRPPAFLDGAEARAAADANLEAFKVRLQLLGCFDSLSDDFSVQVVHHPLGAA
ncbi:hypothetical protein GCM10010472_18880 [Pseudonocardia halophobica]|uniref:Uncharacterized protein n=1 Tax=Pseudonocardia halophobica TaxID=29401 RepID=A0A9W6NUT4_9PSEU|nr:hypothetical protein [Pseudonocardia halophobica]GLL09898.1 hypothetical protein GCM10017577_10380 [Pseudonocardia halophobica]